MAWLYTQVSGQLASPGFQIVGMGYSGFGVGKNNPRMEMDKDIGPFRRLIYNFGTNRLTDTWAICFAVVAVSY